jgi:hypothetical protein
MSQIIGVIPVKGKTQAGQYVCSNGGSADYCLNNAQNCYGDDRQFYSTFDNGRCNGQGGGSGCTPNGCPMCLALEAGNLKDCNFQFAPCPILTGGAGQPNFQWADTTNKPFTGSTDNGNPATMSVGCNYQITGQPFTSDDVNKWLSSPFDWTDFRTQNATNTILGGPDGSPSLGYCFQQVTECPVDIITGKKMPTCSRLISTDPGQCQAWANKSGIFSTFKSQDIDIKMTNYCQRNPNNGDCGCINRQQNQTYQVAKQAVNSISGSIIPDHCWYVPCTVQGSINELVRSTDLAGDCPTTLQVCQNVIQYINQQGSALNNETIQDITQATNCTFTPPTPTPTPTPPTPTPTPTPSPSPNPSSTPWYKTWWAILIYVIVGLLIIGLIIWAIVSAGKKK